MRGKSHKNLGKYLAAHYMEGLPKRYIRAFLIGCVEPDRNPATYFKGSIREQWLRGHNWSNAERYMQRVSARLEARENWHLLDYYAMGKLIHYITDGFTSAHNSHFGTDLSDHRSYEVSLQNYFLCYLTRNHKLPEASQRPVMQTVREFHKDYIRKPVNIHTDCRFAILVCCMVAAKLITPA